jgi:basic amino acid/polyamine antiporter, APA family
MPLERSISLNQAILYGSGTIIGAGIYVLIGVAAGISGNLLWLSFLIAAVIAAVTAFSYAELTHRYPKDAAESVYIIKAFKNKQFAFFIGIITLFTGVFAAATVAWGFASYFKFFVAIDPLFVAIGMLAILSVINFIGIQKSVTLNNILTSLTIIGLILTILFGLRFVGAVDYFTGFDGTTLWENSFSLIPSIFSAAALIFFAYVGFEELANVTEEVKDAKRNTPKAIIAALVLTTILYVLISIVAVSVITPADLANAADPNNLLTEGPLAIVAEKAIAPGFGFVLSILALFATASVTLVLLNVSSRILYGMANEGLMPKIFGHVNRKTKTPHIAIILTLIMSIIFAFVGDIKELGNLTTVIHFFLFFTVNATLVVIRYNEHKARQRKGLHLSWIPWFAVAGAVFCFFMFITQYWTPINFFGIMLPQFIVTMILFALIWPTYWLFEKKQKKN